MAFVEFENVGKTYHMGEVQINALQNSIIFFIISQCTENVETFY